MSEINKLPENMPLTTIVKHTIKLGAEKEFEQWSQNIGKKVSVFKGFKGKYVIPPKIGTILNEYIVAFQFENLKDLLVWMNSNEQKTELKKLNQFSEKEMQLEHQEGIDFWFTTPETVASRPPKWKMSILTWAAVFPMVLLLLELFGKLFPTFNITVKVPFTSVTLVVLLTWILMPNLTRLFKKWLY